MSPASDVEVFRHCSIVFIAGLWHTILVLCLQLPANSFIGVGVGEVCIYSLLCIYCRL